VVAGNVVFGGCVGKSAQFPLQTWLPDAMEGPTPVSALVHSATMVAAGVYLAGRFFPMFTPEVLLIIAYVGCVTLFLAATIAVVATDIKRVLAYSTISQLGYMMLGIGVGGWGAGLFHLITHAFFKSLMFLASGSVIVGCHHEQDMSRMGGLWRKMPVTALTMLAGVIAISGLAIPVLGTTFAFSGYHSKDAIVASALAFRQANPVHFLLFFVPLLTAGITAFYMFRLWFFTFAGQPRDAHIHEHAQESPSVMTGPLIVLSVFAIFVAFGGQEGPLYRLLIHSEPAGLAAGVAGGPSGIVLPAHEAIHTVHEDAGGLALIAAFSGLLLAFLIYGLRVVDPADIARQLSGLHSFLVEKWQFDHLYEVMFVRPVLVVSRWFAAFDRVVIDGFLHALTFATIDLSQLDRRFDEGVIDGMVNAVGDAIFAVGRSLRVIQTGNLRQYIMFIAIGVVALFMLLMMFFPQ
jgi:NADH-quinone oxidoreductase subunit L